MAPACRMIIDTDPGIDDVLAMLLAFALKPEEIEVVLISVTFGNVDVLDCLRNVVSLFHIIQKEQEWRRAHNRPQGFETLNTFRPIVAVGADGPLQDQSVRADFYHGIDGLGGIHSSHPHLTPSETWRTLFTSPPAETSQSPTTSLNQAEVEATSKEHKSFTPSSLPAHQEILRTLASNPQDTITIVAIGPLTNLALAAAEDPATFLRAKEVVVMGGAINVSGNITPLAEFNTHADPIAFARVLALTSPTPSSTMPPVPTSESTSNQVLPASYPPLPRQLSLTILPLDITTGHRLTPSFFQHCTAPLLDQGSPLAEWTTAMLASIFKRIEEDKAGLSLHDPLAVWFAVAAGTSLPTPLSTSSETKPSEQRGTFKVERAIDMRVETCGQWTRGACIIDRRGRSRSEKTPPGDTGGWLSLSSGNRTGVVIGSGVESGEDEFQRVLCERVFGV